VVEPAGSDPVARHADLETASIPTELDFGRYRHAQEVTDSMSIETVDTRARAAAVALVRQRAPETRFLPIAARPVPDQPGYFQVNRVDPTGRALQALQGLQKGIPMLLAPGPGTDALRAAGLPVIADNAADLDFDEEGRNIIEARPQARDPELVAQQALRMARGTVLTASGREVPMPVQTVCVHGDRPNAVAVATAIRRVLADNVRARERMSKTTASSRRARAFSRHDTPVSAR
jgi:hypothetical protein